ncbi:hypothetical protein P43SY_004891 [Pythium insidiosum]|uniref:alpha-1,2-Mannosidase n=1 Tax=Pythium insidiosum TaxID=114742 RepID=A0AAD5LNN8_PYTIN|nr:hypothetical protein P43SY_004891 [Pythium insidiosum]
MEEEKPSEPSPSKGPRHGSRATSHRMRYLQVLAISALSLLGMVSISGLLFMPTAQSVTTSRLSQMMRGGDNNTAGAGADAGAGAGTGPNTAPKEAGGALRGSTRSIAERRAAVKGAMQFIWTNYKERAFGADEMTPITGLPRNPWGSIGCLILDSLDTMWIMGMHEEFADGRKWVASKLNFAKMGDVSVFETIIRALGGLLSAYDLSKDRVFLDKADDLAQRISHAISPTTGRANYRFNSFTNHSYQPGSLAESGTYQLEYEYLAHATGKAEYSKLARVFYPYIQTRKPIRLGGLYASQIHGGDGGPFNGDLIVSFGANGDSFYEYLLKIWILRGGAGVDDQNDLMKKMYLEAMDGLEKYLVQRSTTGRVYIADYDIRRSEPRARMEHLACFVPGLLGLGAHRMRTSDPDTSARHLDLAKKVMTTCFEAFYAAQPTGLAPEVLDGENLEVRNGGKHYILRPEVSESLYILHQVTGDPVYQDWGWRIFEAINTHCRVDYAFAAYRDVRTPREQQFFDPKRDVEGRQKWELTLHEDRMETFFAAETLKYLYLLMDPENEYVSIDTHVFTTEAHPLSMFKKATSA